MKESTNIYRIYNMYWPFSKHLTYMNSIKPYNPLGQLPLLCPFHRQENGGIGRFKNLSKVMLSVNRQIWDVYTDGLVPIACSEPITTPHEVKEHGKKGERKQSTFYPNTDSGDINQKHIYLRDQTWVSCIAGRLFTV